MLFCQVLDLQFFLVDCALILQSSLFLPELVELSALDGIRAIFVFETRENSHEMLVLSREKAKVDVKIFG